MADQGTIQTFTAYGAALDYLQRRFGGLFRAIPVATQVTTTPGRILQADAERVFFGIINLSNDVVMVAPDNQVSTTRGIRLSPLGGALFTNVWDDTLLPTLEWWAQGLAINLDVYLIEVRREVQTGAPKF